jgi:hypothetical protein
MGLPSGFYQVLQTFGVDQYRTFQNPYRETWQPYFPNDQPGNSNWPVFIEGVAVPRRPGLLSGVGDVLDVWPRTVYYGGPVARYYAESYRRIFENWAMSQGMAYDTDVIPVQPNATWLAPHPRTDFVWYVAQENQPARRYRLVRPYGGNFHWVDVGFDTWKYKNFHRQNPTVV